MKCNIHNTILFLEYLTNKENIYLPKFENIVKNSNSVIFDTEEFLQSMILELFPAIKTLKIKIISEENIILNKNETFIGNMTLIKNFELNHNNQKLSIENMFKYNCIKRNFKVKIDILKF